MKPIIILALCFMVSFLSISCLKQEASLDEMSLEGFTSLFNGQSLEGWHQLADGQGEGGLWIVADGTIVGEQGPNREGGILITQTLCSNYEVYAEIRAEYPIDSGLFLRIQPDLLSYQVTIDYRPEGEVGGIYSPGGGGFLVHTPTGKDLWTAEEFNAVRARITGQPPHIEAWINGTKVVDFQDSLVEDKVRVPEEGAVGIQVHPGGNLEKGNKVFCRKIMIKNLKD
ncbi:DUF1080 domain-containing protein [Acidobacteriota bacterium]